VWSLTISPISPPAVPLGIYIVRYPIPMIRVKVGDLRKGIAFCYTHCAFSSSILLLLCLAANELLKQPFYQEITGWLDGDDIGSIWAMEREDIVDAFRPNSTKIVKALRLWRDVKARSEGG